MFSLPEKITVTQEHYNQFLAEREAGVGLTHCCPIHQALRPYMRQHPEVEAFEVGFGWLDVYFGPSHFEDPYAYRTIQMSDRARALIKDVDRFDGPVDTQFPVEIPMLKGIASK